MARLVLLVSFFVGLILFQPGHLSAQIQAPIQVAPQGAIASSTPQFIWQAVSGALQYLLIAQDTSGILLQSLYSNTEVNCDGGTGNCFINSPIVFGGDLTNWWVLGLDGGGLGDLSTGLTFFVGSPNIINAKRKNETIEIVGTNLHFGIDPAITLGADTLTILSKDTNGNKITTELPPTIIAGTSILTVLNQNGRAQMDFNPNVGGLFGGGTPFLLKDSNGSVMGEVFSFASPNSVFVRIPVSISNGSLRFIGMNFFTSNNEHQFITNGAVYFTSSDCTGTPFIGSGLFPGDALHPRALIREGLPILGGGSNPFDDPVRLYVSTDSTKVSTIASSHLVAPNAGTTHARVYAGGWSFGNFTPQEILQFEAQGDIVITLAQFTPFCLPYISPENISNTVPAELVSSDIRTSFPPPYSLEIE